MANLLDVDQAAELLHVSRFMIYKLVGKKALACYRVGAALRFSEEQICDFLEKRVTVPAECAAAR